MSAKYCVFLQKLFYLSDLTKTSGGKKSVTDAIAIIAGVIADRSSGCDGNAVIGQA